MKKTVVAILTASTLGLSTLWGGAAPAKEFNPFEEMQKMQQEMDRIFNEFHRKFLREAQFGKFVDTFASQPAIDLRDEGEKYVLKADMPGAEEKNIKIEVKDGMLKIEAKTLREKREKSENYLRQERFVGDYLRMVSLPGDADADRLKSEYKNGVLTITIPKKK